MERERIRNGKRRRETEKDTNREEAKENSLYVVPFAFASQGP